MSFSSLHIGASALYASQRAVEVAAHNVANASTEGYTRQRLGLQTAVPTPGQPGLRSDGMRGMGVVTMSVERMRDRMADVAYRSEAGVAGAADARASALTRTESVLGPYSEGAPEAFSRFLASWDSLALNPADPAARVSVLASGAALADSLGSTARGLDEVGREVGLRIGDQVAEVNGLLEQVDRLNVAIADASVAGTRPNDLLDRRDTALDRLTSLIGARTTAGEDGRVEVHLGTTPLVQGRAVARITAEGDPVALHADGTPVGASGQVGGHLSVLHADLPDFRAQLDRVAVGLRDAVNAIHVEGTGLDGGTGQVFYEGDDAAGLRLATGLDERTIAASLTGKANDGNNALAMGGLRTAAVVDGSTVAAALRSYGGRMGQAVSDAQRSAATSALGLAGAAQTRAAANGVNVDEEMVDLVKYQHAYSAASRVISVVDAMLDNIINRMGR